MRRLRHSPGTIRAGEAFWEIVKIAAIVAICAAIGIGAGKAMSALTGDPQPSRPAARAKAPPAATATAPALVRVKVTFAGLRPLTDIGGQPSDRSRLRIGLRLRNSSQNRATIDVPRLKVGEDVLRADSGQGDLVASQLRRGLSAGASARGELSFSPGPVTTRRLIRQRRATLLIAGRRISVRFDVAPATPAPGAVVQSPPNATTTAPIAP